MKKRLLSDVAIPALATALGFIAPAQARDPIPVDWSGFYAGVNLGGAWVSSSVNTTVNCSVGTYLCSGGTPTSASNAVQAAGSGTINTGAFVGGVQASYLWQTRNLVYGLETDFDSFKVRGSRSAAGTAVSAFTISSSTNADWLWTVRGRFGMTLPSSSMLVYVTGGLAVTRLQVGSTYSDLDTLNTFTDSKLKTGWTAGAGAEWALDESWRVRAEYLYVDFGNVTAPGTLGPTFPFGYTQGISTSADLTAQVARLGISRKF